MTSANTLQWDITGLVNDWASGALENNGLAIIEGLGGTVYHEIFFVSRDGEAYDYDTPVNGVGPQLIVEAEK